MQTYPSDVLDVDIQPDTDAPSSPVRRGRRVGRAVAAIVAVLALIGLAAAILLLADATDGGDAVAPADESQAVASAAPQRITASNAFTGGARSPERITSSNAFTGGARSAERITSSNPFTAS